MADAGRARRRYPTAVAFVPAATTDRSGTNDAEGSKYEVHMANAEF